MEKLKGKLDPQTSQSDSDSKLEEPPIDSISIAKGLKEEGNKFFQKRDYEAAMIKYEDAIKILPKDHVEISHIRANIATCYMQLDPCEYVKAIHECDLALVITPDHTKSLLKRARCYEALNKLDLALKDVSMVSKLDPKNPMASEISLKLERTLESKGLRVNDSVIELPDDYVEPVEASSALWAQGRTRARKKKNSSNNQDKSVSVVIDKEIKKKVKEKHSEVVVHENQKVKFVYLEDIRVAKIPLDCTLFRLREVLHERYPNLRAVRIKYKDQEGDLVTITTDEELRLVESMRFHVIEVSPEQDPFYGRLVEMKKVKSTGDSFKSKVNVKVTKCRIEDWVEEFAQIFKIQDSEMKLDVEAMEEVVTSDEAQLPFDKAGKQFQEVAARSLLKLGNVHMSMGKKRLFLGETAYEFALEELREAKEKYEKAMEVKPDLFVALLAIGVQRFEEARLSWYYVLVSGNVGMEMDAVQFYENAESNIKRSIEVLGNEDDDDSADEVAKLKSWLDVLLCAVIYERSILEYKLELPIWGGSLEDAIERFELVGSDCLENVAAVISEDSTLRDLRFHMEDIVHIFNEIEEAKGWRSEIPEGQLEMILKRRVESMFHVSNLEIQRG